MSKICGILGALGVFALSQGGVIHAQTLPLPDPTRPPAAVLRALSAKDGATPGTTPSADTAPGATGTAPADAEASSAGLVLSAVRLGGPGGSRATVSGEVVALGDRVGDARVVAIEGEGVVLRGPGGVRRLSLTPLVMKSRPGTIDASLVDKKER